MRIVSMLLDHIFMTIIMAVISFTPMLFSAGNLFKVTHQQETDFFEGSTLFIFALGFSLYFCKDCITGRSLAKRIIKQQVINHKTNDIASPLQCLVRNLFCILWPIEIIVTLFSPTRRIGDFVAGTAVVAFDEETHSKKLRYGQIITAAAIAYVTMIISMSFLSTLFNSLNTKIEYVEASYNQSASKELQHMYADSLNYCIEKSDIRVYDKVKGNDIKYISMIIWMKDDCPVNDGRISQFDGDVKRILYKIYTEGTIKGQIKYVNQSPTHMRMKVLSIQ